MTELGLEEGSIVTRAEEGEIETDAGTIRVVPAWRFLLELEDAVVSS
jgi:predicted AAA+ superfamily ATPase